MFPFAVMARPWGSVIGQSALLDGASGYFSRTFGTPTNNKEWSLSVWTRRAKLTATQTLFSSVVSGGEDQLFFASTDELQFYVDGSVDGNIQSVGKQRDTTAWTHFLITAEYDHSTATSRAKMYKNGEDVTSVSTAFADQNNDLNSAVAHNLGRYLNSAANYFSGYLAEVAFVDGSALTPEDFAGNNIYGVWSPKNLSGLAWGANGFLLDFSNGADLGEDQSGNGNDWAVNGTITEVSESPTDNRAGTVGCFATWNPLDYNSDEGAPTNGNKTCGTEGGNTYNLGAKATLAFDAADDTFFEVVADDTGSGATLLDIGITGAQTLTNASSNSLAFDPSTRFYRSLNGNAGIGTGASQTTGAYGDAFADADVIGVRVNAGSLYFYKNGTIQNSGTAAYTGLTGLFTPCMFGYNSASATIRCAPDEWTQTPSGITGVNALGTANLPDVTGSLSDHFVTVLDTGANILATAQSQFPDYLLWIKDRDNANNHQIIDTVRGASAVLQSNTTAAETTYSAPSGNSVAQVWNLPSSEVNSDGDLTAIIKKNSTLGISVGTFTVPDTSSTQTVGHGCGQVPFLIIVYNRTFGGDFVYLHGYPGHRLKLSNTDALTANTTIWGNTAATSTVFTVGNASLANAASDECFFIAFFETPFCRPLNGEGNSNVDGPFIYYDGAPVFELQKDADAATNWHITDSVRSPTNVVDKLIYANLSNAEATFTMHDFVATGKKVRTSSAGFNVNTNVGVAMAQPLGVRGPGQRRAR